MVFHGVGTTYAEPETRLFRYESTSGGQEHRLRGRMVPNRAGDIRNGWSGQRNLDFFLGTTKNHRRVS